MSDSKFLQFIYDRLKNVYNEDIFFDYMQRLKALIDKLEKLEQNK